MLPMLPEFQFFGNQAMPLAMGLPLSRIVLIFLCLELVSPRPQSGRFNHWKERFGVSHPTEAERARRLKIFTANMREVAQLSAQNDLAKFGATRFSDMTKAEFRRKITGYAPPRGPAGPISVAPHEATSAPASMDWRDKGAVSEVKNQGKCNDCW